MVSYPRRRSYEQVSIKGHIFDGEKFTQKSFWQTIFVLLPLKKFKTHSMSCSSIRRKIGGNAVTRIWDCRIVILNRNKPANEKNRYFPIPRNGITWKINFLLNAHISKQPKVRKRLILFSNALFKASPFCIWNTFLCERTNWPSLELCHSEDGR